MPYTVSSGEICRGGKFKPVQQDLTYPQRLIYRGDYTFFAGPGDPEGFLFEGSKQVNGTRSDGDQDKILDYMEEFGGNVLYIMTNRSIGDGTSDENCWIDDDFNNPVNPVIMSQWHSWLRRAEQLGIIVMFFFWDDQGSGRDNPYSNGSNAAVPAGELDYFTQIMNEFATYENILWVIGEEVEKEYSNARLSNQGAAIRSISDEVLIGIHQLNGAVFQLPTDTNVKFFAIQLNNRTEDELYSLMAAIWPDAVANGYCYAMTEIGDPPSPRGAAMRRTAWISLMAGCCGFSSLEMQFNATGRNGLTDEEMGDELVDCQRLVDFTDSTLWQEMGPNDTDIVSNIKHLLSGNDHHIAWFDAYTAAAQIGNMSAGTYTIRWQSCDNDDSDETTGVVLTSGTNSFTKPALISNECALYIERTA